MSAGALLLGAWLAAQAGGATQAPAVTLLPLLPEGGVTAKQADGVTAQVRAAITADVAKVLATTSGDKKQATKCARDPACLAGIADARGADLLGAGLVSPAEDGLRVSLVVVTPSSSGDSDARRVETTLQGNDGDARRLARLVRSAFNTSALRGALLVTGPEGAAVELDGAPAGTLPLEAPIAGLAEGDHVVVVTKAGEGSFRRSVGVVHGEVTEVKAVLVDSDDATAPAIGARASGDEGIGTDVVVVGSIGASLLVLGGVAGALSLLDALAVEGRAASQNLAFPADGDAFARGNLLAWTANGLYLAGAAGLGAAAVLYALHAPAPDAEPALGGAP